MSDKVELKPCPFCEGKRWVITKGHSVFTMPTGREFMQNGSKKETCYICNGKGTVSTGDSAK